MIAGAAAQAGVATAAWKYPYDNPQDLAPTEAIFRLPN